MKKLLALLIAVMMVVALVPATVLSAIVPAIESLGDGADTGVTPPAEDTPEEGGVSAPVTEDVNHDDNQNLPDERLEEAETAPTFDKEFTEGTDKLELVNKNGELVGYFTDLASADKWVRNGDTLRFLDNVTLTEAYIFGTGREELGDKTDAALVYTVDGNGKAVYYRGTKAYALFFANTSRYHNVTFKNLTVATVNGCIGLYLNNAHSFSGNNLAAGPNSGGGATFTFENCKLYANDSYYYANPEYYTENNILGTPWVKTGVSGAPAFYTSTGNTMVTIKGAETEYYGNSNYAVDAASTVTIHDGFFYSAWADATVQANAGTAPRNTQKLIIYGGTYINDRLCAARAMNGCQLWVFGGDFIMTGETTISYNDSAAIRTSNWNNPGHVYILGGNFYLDAFNTTANKETVGAAVWSLMDYSPAYIAGGNFYHSKADNAFGGKTFNFSRFSADATVTEATENNTKEVYGYWAQKTISWNYVTSVSFDGAKYGVTISENGEVLNAEGEVLFADDAAWFEATKAEVAILDVNGVIIDLLDIDNNTDDASCIHYGEMWNAELVNARATTLEQKLKASWYFVPNGGTWRMITDITSTADPKTSEGVWMFHYGQGADVTVDGNGHTLSFKNTGKYFTFSLGSTNVTFKNIVMENPTGRGLQFGNLPGSEQVWTLAEGAVVRVGDGSAVYMCPNTTLNVLEGAVLEGCETMAQSWQTNLIQIRPNSTFNLLGGTLRAADGDIYASSIFLILYNGDRNINLESGKVYLQEDSLQALRTREGEGQFFALNVSDAVEFYTLDGTPALQPVQGNAAEVTNEGEAPVEYATFAEAMAAVKPGAVVKLLRDVRSFGTNVISCDMTLLGNGYTIYDASVTKFEFVFHIRGANTDVLFDGVTIVTAFSGIYVSPNEVSERGVEDATISKNDSVVINLTLNNCKVVAGTLVANSYDNVDSVGGEAGLRMMMNTSYGALYQNGESTYVKITGADSFYACSNIETITNWGGFLDIYNGFVYGFSATQVMLLRGRENISATTNNQMRSATTAIYDGVFMAGSHVAMSVIRTLRGHSLVIMDGEFVMMEATNPADNDRHVIRVSDSSRAGYLYIMGGDFYQSSSILPVFGWGLASVAYIRIWGGNFWGNCPTGIANRYETSYTFNNVTPDLDMAYGTYIDDGYLVKDYTYTENNRAYPERTKSEYVKNSGYLYHQSVIYDDAWLIENGYKKEGIAYIVTDSASDITPTEYYSFELERALYHLGNGGTFTLVHDVTLNQPAKLTKDGSADTDYGFFTRYRPAASTVTFNTQGKKNFYTITTNVSQVHFLTLAGGEYVFRDFGVINNGGALLKFADDDMTVTISGGRYLGVNAGQSAIDTNAMMRAKLIVESGEFEYDGEMASGAMFLLRADAKAIFGIEGTKVGPTIYKGTMLNAVQISNGIAGEKGADLTIHYADMVDVGFDGRLIAVEGAVQDYAITIYDGEYLLNNTSYYNTGAYWTMMQTPDGSRGIINIHGGNFTREGTGQGRGNAGKLFIFEGDGEVNITGGTFRQNIANILMSVRKNGVLTLNFGDPVTGNGPEFRGNGSTMLSMDSDNTTTAVMNIYAGTYYGNKGGIVGIGKSTGVNGTVNVYGGDYILTSSGSIAGFDAGNGAVNFYNGTMSSTGSGGGAFTVTGKGAVNLYNGTFTASNKFLAAVNGSTFNVYGGNYTVTSDFLYCGDLSKGSFTFNIGMRDGSSGPTMTVSSIASTWLDGDANMKATQMAANINIYACNATITGNGYACYGKFGEFNVYGGDFLMTGQNRLFRIGGYYSGEINIYGGNLISNAGHCLAITDNSSATVVLGKPDGTGPVMYATKNAALDISTTGKVDMTIYGGSYTTEAAAHTVNWVKSGEGSSLLIEDGQFYQNRNNHVGGSVVWLVFTGGKGVATVNGGSFYANNNANSCFYLVEGSCTVNGGYYYSNGMSTIGVIGGSGTPYDADFNKGYITTPSTAELTINGGVFFLDSNWQRSDNADTNRDDSVLRAGGGTGYGTVVINGGTFISASLNGARIINKINGTSSVQINGGVFMASERQEYYFFSPGNVYDADGKMLNAWADPANIPVNRQTDRVVSYNGASYHVYMVEGASTSYVNVTSKAAIRIVTVDMGVTKEYVSGLRFTTTIDGATVAAFAEQNGVEISDIVFGTLIVPEDFLEGLNAFTHADLIAAGREFLDVLADKSLLIDAETGDASFTAAITEILPENYGRRFVAVGYMIAATEEQAEVIGYANYTTGTSLAELATLLLENEVNNQNPYSAELKALLKAFAAALPEGGLPEGGETPTIPDDTEDDDFDVIGGEGDGDGDGDDGDDDLIDDEFPQS